MILHISNCDSFIIIIVIINIIINFDSHYKEITGHASSFQNTIIEKFEDKLVESFIILLMGLFQLFRRHELFQKTVNTTILKKKLRE